MADRDGASLDELSDLCTPWCIRVVATLRIADRLAGGAAGIGELAAATGADADHLHRVLRHLAGKGVFEEPAPGRFGLTEVGRGLLDEPARLGLDLDGFGGRMAGAWAGLLPAVRTGGAGYHEVFGRPFWQDLGAHPDIAQSFDDLIGPPGHGVPDPDVLLTGGWEAVRTVVDVGGGTGALLAAVLRARPAVRGTLVDLPRTVARSEPVFAQAGVAERVGTVGQSFFEPLPAGADLYLLRSVIGNWPDPEATAILRRCAEAAPPAGRVVVINGVTPTPRAGDLLMMVLLNGRDRTPEEFALLAADAGLAVVAFGQQANGRYVVECRPA